ncbi:MAG: MASE3 domain-containing protein, partial [Desulfuromonadaceae bacterium]|nr:MASE3 domain-containing protein [Desulfuromonadaceae bacterium]
MNVAKYRNHHSNILFWLFTITICVGLYLTTYVNYLLFHSLVELFSIIVAAAVFIITWNSVKYIKNPYLIMVGISYLFIAILDLLHTLSYKGMPIFTDYNFYANQLWIAARGLESCTLLAAFLLLFSNKTVKAGFIFILYSLITTLLIASIFYWKIFPVCFVAGKGLTAFKVYSEYAICAILVASIILLIRNRSLFAKSIYKLLLLSMVFTIISELAFTFYINNFGFSNLVGHYFKLFSFMMIYRAIVVTGIEEPYHLIFSELNRTNEELQNEIDSRIQAEFKLESEIKEHKKAEMALRESEFFFRESQRAASIGSYKVDFITGTWESSEILDKILGIDNNYPHNVQGCLDIINPEDIEEMYQYLNEEVISKKTPFLKECRIIRKNDGEMRWVHGLGEVKYGDGGVLISMTGTIQDITARKQIEQELEDVLGNLEIKVAVRTGELERIKEKLALQNEELQNSYALLKVETEVRIQALETLRENEQLLLQQSRQAAMGEMIGNIAHQWRQPLNSLGLFTQSIGFFYGTPSFNKEFVDTSIAKSMGIIKHMSKTIDDFRDYFKPEKEKVDFCMTEAVENTLSLLDGSLQSSKIRIEIIEHDRPVINGYQNEFAQVLINILNNARDALIDGEIADPRVTITISNENGSAVLIIADNAGGIPEEIIYKVFDPYFTTKGPQLGTGIGLFMSKAIGEKKM